MLSRDRIASKNLQRFFSNHHQESAFDAIMKGIHYGRLPNTPGQSFDTGFLSNMDADKKQGKKRERQRDGSEGPSKKISRTSSRSQATDHTAGEEPGGSPSATSSSNLDPVKNRTNITCYNE